MNSSVIMWLSGGVLFGLLTLAGAGGGGYWVYQCQAGVKQLESDVQDAQNKFDRQRKQWNPKEAERLEQKLRETEVELENSRRTRLLSIMVASAAIIPAFLTLIFLVMASIRFMQKAPEPMAETDVADEEPEPAAKPRKSNASDQITRPERKQRD
ncbi:MAG: hypothetical protein FJ303_05900 [Planctomycetes bacterium]|nr:hypothetical protein [Planctomycetota bacterium]